jgi:hypothetical protein
MAKMKATCVRRTHRDEKLTQTYYRISGGPGLQARNQTGPKKYYRDVIVSSAVVAADTPERWRNETLIFAANKSGKIKHTSQGHLVELRGGETGTTSASTVLKNAGVTEITSCATGSSRFDARRRSRRRKRSR